MFDNSVKTRVGKTASTAVYNCALRIFQSICSETLKRVELKKKNLIALDKWK